MEKNWTKYGSQGHLSMLPFLSSQDLSLFSLLSSLHPLLELAFPSRLFPFPLPLGPVIFDAHIQTFPFQQTLDLSGTY